MLFVTYLLNLILFAFFTCFSVLDVRSIAEQLRIILNAMNIMLNSSRRFALVFIEGYFTYSNPAVRLTDFYEPTDSLTETKDSLYEWKYAVQDNIDAVLDLRVGERLTMQFNRDSADSTGIIKRIL